MIEGAKVALISIQLNEQTIGAVLGDDPMICRQRPGVARELFDTEQFSPQRRLAHHRAWPCLPDHPVLKAQRHRLEVVHVFQFAPSFSSCVMKDLACGFRLLVLRFCLQQFPRCPIFYHGVKPYPERLAELVG